MSSSKVFPQDPHFTPTSLVQERKAPSGSGDFSETPLVSDTAPDRHSESETPTATPPPLSPIAEASHPPPDLEAIREESFNQGLAAGTQQYQVELQHVVQAFALACQKIDDLHRAILEKSRGDMINVAISLSKKILDQELSIKRDLIATTLEAALEQAIASEEFFVTLHPDDLAAAEKKVPELVASIKGLEHLIFKTDKSVGRGGCRLESNLCSVDATLEGQLAAAREYLEEQTDLFNPQAMQEAQ